jgi:hypothetical protein
MDEIAQENSDEEYIEYSPEIVDMALDIAWRDYTLCFEDKKEIDQKAYALLAGIGVIIGLIFTREVNLNLPLMYFSVIIFFFSAIYCMFELTLKTYESTSAMSVLNAIAERELEMAPSEAKVAFVATLDKRTDTNRTVYNKLVFWIDLAIPIFVIGIIALCMAFLF